MQDPTAIKVTVLPDTVQTPGVLELKLTGKPEVAEALIVNGAEPIVWLANVTKLMVCADSVAGTTVIETGNDVVLLPKLSVAMAVMLSLPTATFVQTKLYGEEPPEKIALAKKKPLL